jgi:DNA-binding response OmpR family regulator
VVERVREASILIVHPDRKTQRVVQRILGVTGHRVDIADDLEQAARLVQHLSPRLVVLDGLAATSPQAESFFAMAQAKGTEACMTLLEPAALEQMPKILRLGAVTNLLVHPMPVLAEELTVTVQKLIRNDLFGAEKYMLWGTDLHEHTLTRSTQRAELVQQIAEALRARGQSARVASMAMLVADELMSNAVHNAPVDARGHAFRRDQPRTADFELEGRHQVRVRWGSDSRYVAIEVNDQFGTLDRETILGSLAKNDVRESGGGAGMGIALSYRSCDHLVFNLAPGKRTEIIALIDTRYPPTERVSASSYNVFIERAH